MNFIKGVLEILDRKGLSVMEKFDAIFACAKRTNLMPAERMNDPVTEDEAISGFGSLSAC